MNRIALICALLHLLMIDAGAVVVVTYRGSNPNLFPVSPPNPVDESLDINGDGVYDFRFWRDGGLVVGMQGYGANRFISTLAVAPNLGGYVHPVDFGSILGSDSTAFTGDWHHHTDNRGASGFGLYRMQSEDAYIGVEFEIDGSIHYGWIQYTGFYVAEFTFLSPNGPVTVVGANVLGGFIDSWGYETDSGVPIAAGVPEPSIGVLLCIGWAGWVGRRNRKQLGTKAWVDNPLPCRESEIES